LSDRLQRRLLPGRLQLVGSQCRGARTIQESFVDYHEELLFTDLALFNRKLADWLVFYNAERLHHSLSQQSPLSFLLEHQPGCQRY
jgi:transposase InsO family protein